MTRQPGFGALPDPSSSRVTYVVIPSVRFELIHLGLLMPLGLLYTLYGVILLLNFSSPFPPKEALWKPIVAIQK